MPVRLDDTVAQSPTCLAADMGGEVVVMSVERGLYLALDPVGRDIWNRVAAPCTVKSLCGTLLAEYDASAAIIESDVLDLLDTLVEAGVIEVRA